MNRSRLKKCTVILSSMSSECSRSMSKPASNISIVVHAALSSFYPFCNVPQILYFQIILTLPVLILIQPVLVWLSNILFVCALGQILDILSTGRL